jgi:integrase/recombinase XerD
MSNAPKPGATGATNPTNPPTSSTAHADRSEFERSYASLLKHLRLKGMQPKTIEAYAHGIRRLGERFDWRIGALTDEQLTDHFSQLLQHPLVERVKHDLYGYKFFTTCMCSSRGPAMPGIDQAAQGAAPARHRHRRAGAAAVRGHALPELPGVLLHPVQPGPAPGRGRWRCTVGDIDAERMRVHVRDAKGNRDRLVPLPPATLDVLRRFWGVHRNPTLLFPNRAAAWPARARASGAGPRRRATHAARGGAVRA